MSIEDGGFASDNTCERLEDDLDDGDIAAIAREHATMKRWNSLMADECLKKQYRRSRREQIVDDDNEDDELLVGFPTERADDEDYTLNKKSKKKTEEPPPHKPWVYQSSKRWPLDDGIRYALHMLPAHLMRAGRNRETAVLLCSSDFFGGRVRSLGAQKAVLVHRQDLEELERRIFMALENQYLVFT